MIPDKIYIDERLINMTNKIISGSFSSEKIVSDDIEYIRSDLVDKQIRQLENRTHDGLLTIELVPLSLSTLIPWLEKQ